MISKQNFWRKHGRVALMIVFYMAAKPASDGAGGAGAGPALAGKRLEAQWSFDTKHIATAECTDRIKVRTVASPEAKPRVFYHCGLRAFCFSHDGKTLVSAGKNRFDQPSIRLWRISDGRLLQELDEQAGVVATMACTQYLR
jgi:hypothetical protein